MNAEIGLRGELAQELVVAAIAAAQRLGKLMAIAICDAGGNLRSFHRMDEAPLMSSGIAQDKAYTAAGFGRPTHEWYDAIVADPALALGFVHTPRLVIFGGGFPLITDGVLLGGIGVSGGDTAEDMRCAREALSACGLSCS